jgi:hypothetical protein
LNQPPPLYQFPATRFISNTFWQQWWHVLSEVFEIAVARLRGDRQHAVTESWDASQSLETLRHIAEGEGADVEMAREEVLSNNMERGYYA